MIKTAIAGAATPDAGELLRLLVNHPEVDIRTLYAPEMKGCTPTAAHHGLIGETLPAFTDVLDTAKCDVLFICEHSEPVERLIESLPESSRLRLIDLTHPESGNATRYGYIYGLPEMNRKSMVRGATRGVVPGAIESLALVALYPLAANLMLRGDLRIRVEATDGLTEAEALVKAQREIAARLAGTQQSFDGEVSITAEDRPAGRGIRVRLEMDSFMQLEDVVRLYDEIYDDHNFTFMTRKPVSKAEVVGTNRIVIALGKERDRLTVDAVADGHMRGGAGEAVHIMNLLFGLHEKTGLTLKASEYVG